METAQMPIVCIIAQDDGEQARWSAARANNRMNIFTRPCSNGQDVTSQTCHIGLVQGLLDRCVTGDRQAWRDLHRSYYPLACRFLIHMGVTGGDLDDACQEVFVQVFRYLARFERRCDFKTWLYRLCLGQASRVRRRRRLQRALAWFGGHASAVHADGQQWTEAMVGERVQQALDHMKPLHREVFVLFALEGVEGKDIASILGCPASTVRRRLHYARQEFEQLLWAGGRTAGKGEAP